MVNVLAPILVKLLLIEPLIPSMAVNIPTKAIIPKAIMSTVKVVRSNCALMELSASLIFSINGMEWLSVFGYEFMNMKVISGKNPFSYSCEWSMNTNQKVASCRSQTYICSN